MTGVDILSTTEVVTESTCNWWLAGFVFIGVIVLGGIFGFCLADCASKGTGVLIGCLVGALFGIMCWGLVGVGTNKPIAYETQYKVAISDEVIMTEFMEKYEIIQQDEKLYTVRERN